MDITYENWTLRVLVLASVSVSSEDVDMNQTVGVGTPSYIFGLRLYRSPLCSTHPSRVSE